MPVQHQRQSRTGTTPWRDLKAQPDPNFSKDQRQAMLDTPHVTVNAADLTLAAGAPGAFATYTWNPVSTTPPADTIYDPYQMVGPVATTDIRIPWDGMYDIEGSCAFISTNAVFEWSDQLLYAPASDSGYSAPVFGAFLGIPGTNTRNYFASNVAVPIIAPRAIIQHSNMPFFANDLIRIQAQVSCASARLTRWELLVVRWVAPIPNNMLQIRPNHV